MKLLNEIRRLSVNVRTLRGDLISIMSLIRRTNLADRRDAYR